MSDTGMQDYVFTAKYSTWNHNKHRRETFQDACDRVLSMHKDYFANKDIDVSDLLDTIRPLMYNRIVLGSQRALQFGGVPIIRKNMRLYNCAATHCNRPRVFQEILWTLLCGTGVGISVQRVHIEQLPCIAKPTDAERVYTIPDTIEGWADALGMLLSSYFVTNQPFPEVAGHRVEFNFSQIRPEGSDISNSMGKAPGPEPLRLSLDRIRALLDGLIKRGITNLRAIDACDIICHTAAMVLSGGIRRSACLMLFSPDDQEMLNAKAGNWLTQNPQRAHSNNSVALLRNSTTKEQFDSILERVRDYGEPGFVWLDDLDICFNPCVEISLFPKIDGESGIALCNLTEININKITNRNIFAKAAEAAAILGTLQAAYTSFPYLGSVTERIVQREALLGVSLTGMMERPALAFNPELQTEMAEIIKETNTRVAAFLGINPSARSTCVKPSGTAATILGTSAGIHPHHSKRFIRHVQANRNEPTAKFYASYNPHAITDSVWSTGNSDIVLRFCVEPEQGSRTKKDLSAVQFLELITATQKNWIRAGKREELCAHPALCHNVSCTVVFKPEELSAVGQYIFDNKEFLTGVSLLADGGDLDYNQAPFVEVPTAEEIVKAYGVGALMASGLIVDGLSAFDDNLWAACDYVLGRGEKLETTITKSKCLNEAYAIVLETKQEWGRRAEKFALNYFAGDRLQMTRCLKRVHTCKLWEDLRRNYKEVDYTKFVENYNDAPVREMEIACSGGSCSVIHI